MKISRFLCLSVLAFSGCVMAVENAALVVATPPPIVFEALPAVEFRVSPKGDDANDGSAAKPVRTLARAVELTRELESDAPKTIIMADGTYPFTRAVEIGRDDYGLTIKAEHPGQAILTGAADVTGWRKDEKDPRFLVAPMPFDAAQEMLYLFMNGDEVCEFSSYPEFFGSKTLPYQADESKGEHHHLVYKEKALPKGFDFSDLDTASAWLILPQEWATTRTYILTNDVANHAFDLKTKSDMPLGRFNQGYKIMNTRLGLRKPGMWMFEATAKRIIYWPKPGETAENLKCRITGAPCILDVRDVSSLALDGLVIEGCRTLFSNGIWSKNPLSAAVSVKCSRNVTVDTCEIRNTAGAGIMFLKADTCKVLNSHVHHCGTSAVDFVDGGEGNVEVSYCHLHDTGLLSTSGCILHLQISDVKAIGNHIHDGTANGIVMWARNALVASNHIHHVMSVSRDGGGLYGAYNYSMIKDNHVHDTGGWPCLYADEGAMHTVFTGNRCEHWWPTHMHCTRYIAVTNNVFTCPGKGLRFSFQGSGAGIFSDNTLYLGRDIVASNDYISLESCAEWARNDVYVKEGEAYKSRGLLTLPAGKKDRVEPVPATVVDEGVELGLEDGKKINGKVWKTPWNKALYPELLAEGGSVCGCPNTQIKVAYDAGYVYVRATGSYNAFTGYLGCRNTAGHGWGHWDGTKLYFGNGLEVAFYPDGTAEANDKNLGFGKGDIYATSNWRGVEYAVRIPLSALGLSGELVGKKIPFNVCCHNEDHRLDTWGYRPKGRNKLTGTLEFMPKEAANKEGK